MWGPDRPATPATPDVRKNRPLNYDGVRIRNPATPNKLCEADKTCHIGVKLKKPAIPCEDKMGLPLKAWNTETPFFLLFQKNML